MNVISFIYCTAFYTHKIELGLFAHGVGGTAVGACCFPLIVSSSKLVGFQLERWPILFGLLVLVLLLAALGLEVRYKEGFSTDKDRPDMNRYRSVGTALIVFFILNGVLSRFYPWAGFGVWLVALILFTWIVNRFVLVETKARTVSGSLPPRS